MSIETMKKDYPIALLCACLQVGRSSYYAWKNQSRGQRVRQERLLISAIHEAFRSTRRTYGYPRMTAQLRQQGLCVSKHRVARLMRQEGLQGRQKKRFRPITTLSNHTLVKAPHRQRQVQAVSALNQVWQSDITYIATGQGWLYLATVMDAFSRRIIGWDFSESLHADIAIKAFQMARQCRGRLPRGLIFHSDQGVQYACGRFRNELQKHHCLQSMSRRGNCYDNAKSESFFSTLKMECVYRTSYCTRAQARSEIFEWMESFYNLKRRHSALGYRSPIDFELMSN